MFISHFIWVSGCPLMAWTEILIGLNSVSFRFKSSFHLCIILLSFNLGYLGLECICEVITYYFLILLVTVLFCYLLCGVALCCVFFLSGVVLFWVFCGIIPYSCFVFVLSWTFLYVVSISFANFNSIFFGFFPKKKKNKSNAKKCPKNII